MKKTFVKSLVAAAIGSLMMVGGAFALSLPDVSYSWSNADYWTGTQPDVDFELKLYKDAKLEKFGIYSVDDISAATSPYRLNIFNDADAIDTEATIAFTNSGKDALLFKGGVTTIFADFGSVFGFFAEETFGSASFWYTDASLNSDGMEHIFVAAQDGSASYLDNAHVYAARSFTDPAKGEMSIKDIAPVPEPATMLLFGTGLMGLAAVARRKKSNK